MLNTTEKSVVFLFAFIKILLYTNYGGFMKKVIYLNSNNLNLFYRKFRLYKFLSHFNINFIINYCGKEYTLNDKYPQELGIILNMTDILNTRNKKEKYNKIYINVSAKSYCISNLVVGGSCQGILGQLGRRTCK